MGLLRRRGDEGAAGGRRAGTHRAATVSDVAGRSFDVVVIGAGINGAGIARDAALRGLRVLLVEQEDIGSETTAWSTRLIHGGLRYLEHYEIPLVRESLRERAVLLRIAPHLVRPLPFLIPIYRGMKRGPLIIRAGMTAYDALSLGGSLPRHQMLGAWRALREEPGLAAEGLRGAARYYDAQAEYTERLALENALSAAESGAVVVTHARVHRLLGEHGRIRGIEMVDARTGDRGEAYGTVTVNSTGPWADTLTEGLGQPQMVGGTIGAHIVVRPFPGAPQGALYVEATADNRPYFIVPWNDLYLIGTTDERFEGDPADARASLADAYHLLRETNRVLPSAGLQEGDILYTYAGVRPLPYTPSGAEGAITRRHIIRDPSPALEGLISILGGKLTTYRNLAEQCVDLVLHKLGMPRIRSLTAERHLPGARGTLSGLEDTLLSEHHMDPLVIRRLVRIYGVRARDVLSIASGDGTLAQMLSSSGVIAAEIPFGVRYEMAGSLTDILMRRTMAGLGPSMGLDVVEPAAEVAIRALGWDERRAQEEVDGYRHYLQRFRPTVAAGS